MFGRQLPRFALPLVVCAVVLAGCGGGDEERDLTLRGKQLTIYSSLPLHGPASVVAADVIAAQQIALEQAGGRVGRYRIRLVAVDASSPQEGHTDPSRISENARRAAQNDTTIAYLGELATGMSAVSIPLLNEAGILEVSPLDSAMTLTTGSIAATGSPERFYPRLEEVGRTFARVVPSDRSQADALLAAMRAEGVRRLAVVTDEDPSGRALATRIRALARAAGVLVVAREEIDVHAREHDEAIARIAEAQPDAVLDATGARAGSARLWRELTRAGRWLLFGPAALADERFVAALGPAGAVARITRPADGAGARSPAVRRFARAFAERVGRPPLPEALYGYESMRSVLAAIARAARATPEGLVTRAAVVRAYFRTQPRESVLGPYAIDSAGDSSLRRWGTFGVLGGELRAIRTPDGDPSAER